MRIYRPYGHVLRFFYRLGHLRWKSDFQEELQEPCVYVVHHQNMYGPLHTVGLMPQEARIWAYHVFCERESCFTQFYEYTFRERFKWSDRFSYFLAKLLSFLVPPILRGICAIPVYHGGHAISTMRESLATLEDGMSLVICPDSDYTSTLPQMGDMQDGFFLLHRMFFQKTESSLPFVPVFCSAKQRKVCFGKAVYFQPDQDYAIERIYVEAELIRRMNEMGVQCGDIDPDLLEKQTSAEVDRENISKA